MQTIRDVPVIYHSYIFAYPTNKAEAIKRNIRKKHSETLSSTPFREELVQNHEKLFKTAGVKSVKKNLSNKNKTNTVKHRKKIKPIEDDTSDEEIVMSSSDDKKNAVFGYQCLKREGSITDEVAMPPPKIKETKFAVDTNF
ncbi:hypothetical protein RN001_016090 [Aquatica leii]|uniref:Uncharacterized protein n=1 Tax=Aquatica leii TaxID=1421715 RepID=A0AAN7S5Z4_9COLE|nr:hypothetical protein RN001_016090 [Aquatica leii]